MPRNLRGVSRQLLASIRARLARVTLYVALYYTQTLYKYTANFASCVRIRANTIRYTYIALCLEQVASNVWEAGATGNNGGK